MSTPEGAITSATPDVTASSSNSGVSETAASSPAQDTATSSADVNTQQAVQGDAQAQPQANDPLAGFPPDTELQTAVQNKVPWAEMASRLKGAYSELKPRFEQLTQRYEPFNPILDRFEKPEQLQSILDFQSALTGWENDPQSGELIPATQLGAQQIVQNFPQHAPYLTSDLLDQPMIDPVTGEQARGVEIMLRGMAADPQERQLALKILGGVEPSSIAPQWQATEEELTTVKPELQDFYKSLPWEEREELKALSPEYLNKTLQRDKLNADLQRQVEREAEEKQQVQQRREAYVNQQANQAGEQYKDSQLNSALSTFHESVVQQCNFIQPLDPANLPQGMTPEQATQMNAQIAASNKAEAAQITGLIVSLFNPQTSAYVIPLLKEIGAVDDKLLGELNQAATQFGNNARNFGHLQYRGKLTANGNGYTPSSDVTSLSNEAERALKKMVAYANQIKKAVIDHRSNFFSLKATEHNATLNGSPVVRPQVNGSPFDPTQAVSTGQPTGWLTRSQLNQQYG